MESKTGYENPSIEKVITKKDLNKMIWRSFFLQASFNYERMQACGWLFSILPGLKKIHTNKKDLSLAMKDHLEFFNTHPFLVNFIMGLVISMEEIKQDRNTIRAIKVATMGPLGGIGDSLFWLTALPIIVGIGAELAISGNIAGPFVFLIFFNVLHFGLRWFLMSYGYNTGVNAIASLKEKTKNISHAVSIIGLVVVGGLVASMVNLQTKLVINAGKASVNVQEVIDQVMPKMLPVLYVFLMYILLKKGKSPVILILITIIIGVIGKYIGIL